MIAVEVRQVVAGWLVVVDGIVAERCATRERADLVALLDARVLGELRDLARSRNGEAAAAGECPPGQRVTWILSGQRRAASVVRHDGSETTLRLLDGTERAVPSESWVVRLPPLPRHETLVRLLRYADWHADRCDDARARDRGLATIAEATAEAARHASHAEARAWWALRAPQGWPCPAPVLVGPTGPIMEST